MIDANMVAVHFGVMAQAQQNQLSAQTLAEMRPDRIGYRLMLLREAHNLKPSEMADRLGIQRTYWSRFENGGRALNDTTAALLVDTFDVTLDFLILGRWNKLPLELSTKMRAVEANLRASRLTPETKASTADQ